MANPEMTAIEKNDKRIVDLGDWRGDVFGTLREIIHSTNPNIVEDVKWVKASAPDGVATYELDGLICTEEVYKAYVKLTFPKGSLVDDPDGLFNASLSGVRRAIDFREGDKIKKSALKKLIKSAVQVNAQAKAKR